jgi:broad specificity phosphatase PhoE
MAKIIVVRHAESIANTLGIYQGQTYNTDLSPLGKKQALALAKKLYDYEINKILVSPLKRTMQTANPVAVLTEAKVELSKEILETNHGLWEGKNKDWIKINFPEVYEKWLSYPGEAVFPQGEAFIDTVNRVEKFLFRKEWIGTNLVVTHDNIIRIMICLAQRRAVNDLWKFDLEPAAINIFEMLGVNGRKSLRVIELNNCEHLKSNRAKVFMHAL